MQSATTRTTIPMMASSDGPAILSSQRAAKRIAPSTGNRRCDKVAPRRFFPLSSTTQKEALCQAASSPDKICATLRRNTRHEDIVAAARLVKKGKVISLALNFDNNGPQGAKSKYPAMGRINPVHTMLRT